MFGINLPGLNNLMPKLPFGLPTPPLLPPLGLPLPLPFPFPLPGGQQPQVQGDKNNVQAPTGGAGAPGKADIDNVNLDAAELRALDNLMQTYLADGKFTPEEQKTYTEIRDLFARKCGTPTPTPAPAPNPTGGSVPPTPTPPPTPCPPKNELWPVGDHNANGRTFRSWGDPHEVSGDGGKFDNMKTGTFTKMKSASGDFEVQTTQAVDKTGRWPGATLNHKAAIKSGNDVVAYDGLAKTMTINGANVAIPKPGQSIALPGGGSVTGTADGVQVTTAKGDKVNIHQKDAYIDISGEISANRKDGEVRGSLGAFDADTNAGNDLIGRDGKSYKMNDAKSLDAFLEDWRTKPGEDLFAAKDPAGGGVPGTGQYDAEFAALDKTGNGYLSGSEITPELKTAFPGKERITKEDFVGWKATQAEAAAVAKDEADFNARDINKDGQLDGNEVGGDAKYDKGGNWARPDGSTQTEISKAEFMAGRAAERKVGAAAPANPPAGGGAQTEGPKFAVSVDDIPAIAKARKAKRKKKKRGFFSRLTRGISKMAGNVFRVATNLATAPLRTGLAVTQGALGVATNLAGGNLNGAIGAGLNTVQNVRQANDPFAGVQL